MQDELIQVQPKFKSQLLEAVEVFREDVSSYEIAYDTVMSLISMPSSLCVANCHIFLCLGLNKTQKSRKSEWD